MNFQDAKKIGDVAEDEFVEFLRQHGWDAAKSTSTHINERRFYDIWGQKQAPKKPQPLEKRPVITFEIKFDKRVQETGNVYFEHAGLEYSRADYIVYKLDTDGKFYLQERPTVLQLIKLPQFKQVLGGDKKTAGTLIPEEMFKKLFANAETVFAEKPEGETVETGKSPSS